MSRQLAQGPLATQTPLYQGFYKPGLHLMIDLQEDGVAVQEARAGLVSRRRSLEPRIRCRYCLGEPAAAVDVCRSTAWSAICTVNDSPDRMTDVTNMLHERQ